MALSKTRKERINDVDAMLCSQSRPVRSCRGRRNRYPALLFLLHPVHCSSAIMHLTYSMHTTGVKKNALRRRGLAGIDVRHDADVSQQWKWRRPRHLSVSRLVSSIVTAPNGA